MKVLGFDFGTTNSLFSTIKGGKPINYFDDYGLPIPSVVCYEATETVTGRHAKDRLATAGLGVYGNIVRSPKLLLGQESVFVDGVERSVIDVVADLINGIRQAASATSTRDLPAFDAAVVTIPINFEGYRRAALRNACQQAGLRVVQFVHEPLAALYGHLRSSPDPEEALRRYDRQIMLVFDWGGGTLDLTLCRLEHGTLLQIANDGTDEVGGDYFDDAIRSEVIRTAEAATEARAEIHPDAMARLLHRCERAKIDLSTRDSVEIYVDHFFRRPGNDSLEHTLARADLEQICQPLVQSGVRRIRSLLDAAGVSPAQVALCLATGGMISMPMIKAHLHELFGPQRVHVAPDGGSATSEGAAWIAHDMTPLRLAKNVEVLLARNSFLSLIAAGTEMPMEHEVRKTSCLLYCVDPRDGMGKIQIVSPKRPGVRVMPNDQRNHLATMGVNVHSDARPFLERIELELAVDDNLVLHAKATSTMAGDTASMEIHNLEFGVAVGERPHQAPLPDSTDPAENPQADTGAVTVRANLTKEVDHSAVPGELWYKHSPQDFDTRRNPPRIQVEERLYYEPCAKCGRMINDPLCRCGIANR